MKYRDELDKSYGVAGMALGLSVFDAADLFTAVTLDGEGPGCIQFTPEFYFAGNPRLSPRGSWQYILGRWLPAHVLPYHEVCAVQDRGRWHAWVCAA